MQYYGQEMLLLLYMAIVLYIVFYFSGIVNILCSIMEYLFSHPEWKIRNLKKKNHDLENEILLLTELSVLRTRNQYLKKMKNGVELTLEPQTQLDE